MAIITADQIRIIGTTVTANQRSNFQAKRTQLNEARRQGRPSIFLSHSHSDQIYIEPAIQILQQQGADVYVDWQDNGMPKQTSGVTADRLKSMIRLNQKFILLASPTAINSTWVNWELGIADGIKYLRNMAILPIVGNSNTSWPNFEYFQIYGRIEVGSQTTINPLQQTYTVYFPDGTSVSLRQWLLSNY